MSDIVQRLRDSSTQARALDRAALLNEAADEIVKIRREVADLRGGLTDAEREAVEVCERGCRNMAQNGVAGEAEMAATLRALLERMK